MLRQILGEASVVQWLSPEMPRVQTSRVDLLGRTTDQRLIHIELQSNNDRSGPDAKDPDFSFRYAAVDFRDLDGTALLESEHVEDNVLAILTRLRNNAPTVQQILGRLANIESSGRRALFTQFLIISGLRHLEETIKEEAHRMPVLNDILSHKVIGPAILQGRKEGREEGRQEGKQAIVRSLIEKRFGAVPSWIEDRLAVFSASDLDSLAVRLIDVQSLEELFRKDN